MREVNAQMLASKNIFPSCLGPSRKNFFKKCTQPPSLWLWSSNLFLVILQHTLKFNSQKSSGGYLQGLFLPSLTTYLCK